jgi:hypothetical protein
LPPEGQPVKEVFTPRLKYLRWGLFGLLLFLTMLIASVYGMYLDDHPDRRLYGMLFAGVVWGFMTGVAGWIILAYYRESVSLDGEQVRVAYVLGQRSFRLGEVTRARWRLAPQSLSLKTFLPDGKVVIWLDNYPAERRVRLIRYLHDRLSPQVQDGWDERLERYTATIVQTESAEAQERMLRGLWRCVPVGPMIGLGCALAISLYASCQGVAEIPNWSGSVLVDWIGIGLFCSLGMIACLHGVVWLTAPDRQQTVSSPLATEASRRD